MKAAIYARISMDREGGGEGVARQLEDCRALIAAKGWEPAGEYVDNDVSAFSGKKRPEFEEMLLARSYDTVVVWKSDRLARRGRDLQRFLDTGATLTSCTEPEFTGSTGLLMLRILAGFAEHESGVKQERVKRKMRQKAEQGDPHAGGARTYGFSADGRCLVPEEAQRLQEAAQRVLAGESLTAVCNDWQRLGVATVGGGIWQPSNLSRILRSAKLIGMRDYYGELFQGTWPPVLERKTWDRLRATLDAGKRGPTGRKWLLTGLLICGRCGCSMVGGSQSGGKPAYTCLNPLRGGCGKCAIMADKAEPYVIGAALARIPFLAWKESPDDEPLREALAGIEADIAQLSKDHYVDKMLSRPAFLAAYSELEDRLQGVKLELVKPKNVLEDRHIADHWDTASLSWRQAVLKAVLESVTIVPGRATVEDRVRLAWRG